ncbi:MAG: YihA family ribosome biogenesis GTP-binding protein [Bacteroidetes bacterium]|nr:YihA family ribosome biogenesis GTP-binding protein [Bacteroidota bacterium]
MIIRTADFLTSSADYRNCPAADKPEFAFIGRSNVGKSSLINMLTMRKGLAKTSGSPGKTQLINHFIIDEIWYLVDLPGYGFAKVPLSIREKWEKMIRDYLLRRENLLSTVVLIDARLEPQQIDLDFLTWLGEHNIPFSIVFTKADKLTRNELSSKLSRYKKTLLDAWEELPPVFVTSSETGDGKEELLKYFEEVSLLFKPEKQ